jgi:hypothetical protein
MRKKEKQKDFLPKEELSVTDHNVHGVQHTEQLLHAHAEAAHGDATAHLVHLAIVSSSLVLVQVGYVTG